MFTALCCLGFPALLSFLAAIGLGFLINDAILIPFLLGFLGVTLWGLYLGRRHHRSWSAFTLGALGAAVTLVAIALGPAMLGGVGIAALIGSSVLNVVLRARQINAR